MEHYICKGACECVSNEPGVCCDNSCLSRGKQLESCACENVEAHKIENSEKKKHLADMDKMKKEIGM